MPVSKRPSLSPQLISEGSNDSKDEDEIEGENEDEDEDEVEVRDEVEGEFASGCVRK